jgi:predicted CoA-binding protein
MRTRLAPAGWAFAVFLVLHGFAHFAGAAGGSGLPAFLWGVTGGLVIASGVGVAVRAPGARAVVGIAAATSLFLSVAFLWAAVVGAIVDAFVLLVVRRNPRGVFPRTDTDTDIGVDVGAADRFLAGRRIAVVGASSDPRKFGNTIFRELRAHGYDAIPVNPHASEVEGVTAYAAVTEVPGAMDGVMVMVPGDDAVDAVHAAAARGVTRVWLFRGLGAPGAVSGASLAACAEHHLDVVAGACPMMFLEPVGRGHDVHRALRRFNGAFTHAA